jgi:hypothetical protein
MAQDIQVKIKTAIDTLDAAKGVGDLKKSLRELKGLALETGDTNSAAFQQITRAIGETNDKIGDLNAVIKSQSGEPIENLKNSFSGLRSSITSLDFKSAKQQFSVLTDSAKGLAGQFLGGFNVIGNFNKAIAAGSGPLKALTTSFYSLGTSIAATGIGALVIAVVLLIANFDKLAESGGALGVMFTAIGDTVQFVMDKLIELSDWLGLTDIKNQERSKNAIKAAQSERESITSRYDAEIAKAEAAGKSVDELNKKKNAALAYSINQEILQYENLKKSKGKLNEDEQKELAALYGKRNDLVTANQVIDIKAQKEKEDRDKEASKKAKEKLDEDNKKKKEAEEKYKKELADLNTKYILDERQQLEKKFTDDLAKIKGNSEAEKKLRLEIEADKVNALKSFDDKVKADQLAKDQEAIDKKKALDDAAFEANKKKLEDDELLLQGDLQKQLEFLDKHYQEKGMTDNEYFVARAKLSEDITKKEKEEKDKQFEEEKKARDEKFKVAQDFVSAASGLADLVSTIEMAGLKQGTAEYEKAARRKFEISKALQLSTAIITGIQSVMDAFANGMKNPVPLLGPATATIYAVTAGIAAAANIAKIASTQYKSTSASSAATGTTPTLPGAGPTREAPAGLQAPSTIGLGQMTISPQAQKNNWQKVYVVESEIRNTTNKVEVIENRSVLGS